MFFQQHFARCISHNILNLTLAQDGKPAEVMKNLKGESVKIKISESVLEGRQMAGF